jgi:hypothetical protein
MLHAVPIIPHDLLILIIFIEVNNNNNNPHYTDFSRFLQTYSAFNLFVDVILIFYIRSHVF